MVRRSSSSWPLSASIVDEDANLLKGDHSDEEAPTLKTGDVAEPSDSESSSSSSRRQKHINKRDQRFWYRNRDGKYFFQGHKGVAAQRLRDISRLVSTQRPV